MYLLQQSQQKSSTLKWKIPHGATLYRNKIDFRVGHDLDKVMMVARPTYFEVQYDCSARKMHPPVHRICSDIREDILNGLKVVIRSRNYTCKTTPLISFYCPRPQCTPTPHIAVCEGKNPSVMECSSSKEPIGLLSSHFIWFGKVSFLNIHHFCKYAFSASLVDYRITLRHSFLPKNSRPSPFPVHRLKKLIHPHCMTALQQVCIILTSIIYNYIYTYI